jgi:hypothetical protein
VTSKDPHNSRVSTDGTHEERDTQGNSYAPHTGAGASAEPCNAHGGLQTPFELSDKGGYFDAKATANAVDSKRAVSRVRKAVLKIPYAGAHTSRSLDTAMSNDASIPLTNPTPPLLAPLPVHPDTSQAQSTQTGFADRLDPSARSTLSTSRYSSPFASSPSLQYLSSSLTAPQSSMAAINHVSTAGMTYDSFWSSLSQSSASSLGARSSASVQRRPASDPHLALGSSQTFRMPVSAALGDSPMSTTLLGRPFAPSAPSEIHS